METPYESDVKACVQSMTQGGVILYPTDTIWGLGCDAHQAEAIDRIFEIKKRSPHKSFVVLMTDTRQLSKYLANPLPDLDSLLEEFIEPTTVVYENAINLPDALLAADGSIAVRITRDPFCRSLIKRLRAPLVSTSANISGTGGAAIYSQISDEIKNAADYIVHWRRDDESLRPPSSILKLQADGIWTKIR